MSDSNDKLIEKKLEFLSKIEPKEQATADAVRKTRQRIMDLENEKVEFNRWRIIMKSPITKFAAAAAIIIAVLIAINQFGGSIDLANKAFAEVAQKVKKAKTVSWTSKSLAEAGIFGEGNDNMKFKIIEPYHARVEFPDGKIWILDYSVQKGLIIDPGKKTAEVLSLLPNTLSVYDDYKNLLNLEYFRVKKAGSEILNGKVVTVFEVKGIISGYKMTIYADPETKLPVRIETTMMGKDIALTDLTFDAEIDQTLFTLDIPEGFQETKLTEHSSLLAQRVQSATNLKKIVIACWQYSQKNQGQWPDNLEALADYGITADILAHPGRQDLKIGYTYLKPQTNGSPQKVVLYETYDAWGEGINVAFFDGHIEFIKSEDNFKKMLAEN